MAMINRTGVKGAAAYFVRKVTPSFRKGNPGNRRYGPTHCDSKRAASNVRRYQ